MKKIFLILILFLCNYNSIAQCIESVATGAGHSGYIDNEGTLWMWGRNVNGQLGNDSTVNSNIPIRIGVEGEWKSLGSILHNHTLAIKKDGTLWQWGSRLNPFGTAPGTDNHIPTQIGTDSDWKSVSSSQGHIMAIKNDGTLWGLGFNNNGQIGNNSYTNQPVPVKIGFDNDWRIVRAGGSFTVAIKNNGTLWAWGGYPYFMTINKQKIPLQIGNDTNWVSIDAGNNFLVALKSDGTMWEWGQKGTGTVTASSTTYLLPTQTNTDSDWKTIDSSLYKFYAIKNNGTLYHWGDLYTTTTPDIINPNNPTPFGTDNNWESVYSGATHTIAIKRDGSMWIWGSNYMGDLGIGSTEPFIYTPSRLNECKDAIPILNNCGCECVTITNPVYDFINILGDDTFLINEFTIFDVSGKSIFQKADIDNLLYVGNLQDGVYFVEILCNGKNYYKKFIKL